MPIPLVHVDPCDCTVVDQHGQIVMRCQTLDLPQIPGHRAFAEAAPENTYRDGDVWVPMPARPSEAHVFDWTTKTWSDPRTLVEIKAARWSEIKRHRDLLEASGFPYLGKVLDSDARSVARINTAVQAAQAALATSAPFSITWTCADNTALSLDGAGMLGVPVALALYADQLHQICKTLRARIDAAATPAEVQAVAWPTTTPQE